MSIRARQYQYKSKHQNFGNTLPLRQLVKAGWAVRFVRGGSAGLSTIFVAVGNERPPAGTATHVQPDVLPTGDILVWEVLCRQI